MQNPTVSLIVPCYNAEKKCENLIQSLLRQTFTDVQLIFVNDGSADDTEKVLMSWKEPLEKAGYSFEYYWQKNGGVSAAMNEALKHVCGEFLCWIDPDDYLEDNAFEVRVNYMQEHPECDFLTCESYCRKAGSLEITGLASSHYPHTREPKQFEYMLHYKSLFYVGSHMVRMSAFRKAIPQMQIYDSRRGQNWQLLLPVMYHCDRHFLDVPVFDCVTYEDSLEHSHVTNYESRLKTIAEDEQIMAETVKRIDMPIPEREKYLTDLRTQALQLEMYAARAYNKKEDFLERYRELKKRKALTKKDILRKYRFLLLKK